MDLAKLRSEFLVDDDVSTEKLSSLIESLLPHCVVSKKGKVEIKQTDLSGRQLVKLVLVARLVAHKLDESVGDEVNAEELAESTGLPKNQATARAKECVDEDFAERSARGNYRARPRKVDAFLSELAGSPVKG
jgi:hypothetical protein